jgi:carbonic anhydrase
MKMRAIQAIASIVFASVLTSCQSGSPKTVSHEDTLRSQTNDSKSHTDNPRTPYEVLSKLKQGNRRFVMKLSPSNLAHDSTYDYFEQIAHTRNEQHPFACILTCMDSRVPPEIIFDQGIGSLFVVRVEGNIEDPDVLGSMEYAVAEKGVPVIVVMGHKNCGAIHAAFDKRDTAKKQLVTLIAQVKKDIVPNDKPPYDASAKHNVKKTIENILRGSQTIREKQAAGKLIIVGALYDVGNGSIDWNTDKW